MIGTNLGEFEKVVLSTLAALMRKAYRVASCNELSSNTSRSLKAAVVYSLLNRLEEKRLGKSQIVEAMKPRSKSKTFCQLITLDSAAVVFAKPRRERLSRQIASLAWKKK